MTRMAAPPRPSHPPPPHPPQCSASRAGNYIYLLICLFFKKSRIRIRDQGSVSPKVPVAFRARKAAFMFVEFVFWIKVQ